MGISRTIMSTYDKKSASSSLGMTGKVVQTVIMVVTDEKPDSIL